MIVSVDSMAAGPRERVATPRAAQLIECVMRDLRGLRTLQEMSDLCGVHRGTLSQIERGERNPRLQDIPRLELAYGPQRQWYVVVLVAATVGASPAAVSEPENGAGHCDAC